MRPRDRALSVRLLVLAALMGGTAAAAAHLGHTRPLPPREALSSFPLALDGWEGREQPALAPDELAALGADDYLDRRYARGTSSVALYVGYYASQRQGDSVHSPLNCLPGTGWMPVETGYLTLPRGGGTGRDVAVRRLRVRRGSDEALVLYWYQSRGRIVANEYWSKAYLMYDAVRRSRTDTALVRAFTMIDEAAGGVPRAERDVVSFVRSALPLLDRHLPQ